MKKYKVSSLAKEMGVSADLLKLYEEHGLLAPHRDPQSRYRYYNIYDGGKVVSSMTLRNMGFSVRQTGALLSGSSLPEVSAALEVRLRRGDGAHRPGRRGHLPADGPAV